KRFAAVNVENTEENRRAYRELLLTTPKLGEYISGAILFDETIRQSTRDGVPFTKVMMDNGIIPGIKVDKGPHPLAGFPGEVVTEGLDGLRDRL
ncbi:fructose-bisphosphate aldolase, partial [Acinetobacter baumannii]|nr:fructose-bisphosphate aldolase [Acinetobacter baumannii]